MDENVIWRKKTLITVNPHILPENWTMDKSHVVLNKMFLKTSPRSLWGPKGDLGGSVDYNIDTIREAAKKGIFFSAPATKAF